MLPQNYQVSYYFTLFCQIKLACNKIGIGFTDKIEFVQKYIDSMHDEQAIILLELQKVCFFCMINFWKRAKVTIKIGLLQYRGGCSRNSTGFIKKAICQNRRAL